MAELDRWQMLCDRALNLLSEREGFKNDRPWILVDSECNGVWHAAVWHRGASMFGYRSIIREDALRALAAKIVDYAGGIYKTDFEIDTKDLPTYEELDLRLSSYGF